MKINILLPHREKFDKYKASSVSITIKNNLTHSKYHKFIMVYGQDTEHPISSVNFTGIKNPLLFFKSKNKNLAKKMCKIILSEKNKNQIVEVHNRPYLLNVVYKYLNGYHISLFLHNDPQEMSGSKTIKERVQILKKVRAVFCVSAFIKKQFLEGITENKNKVFVIHNGVERLLKSFPKKYKEIIFSGRFVPEKGVNLYVNAITKVAKKFPDWKFRLIGSAYLGSSNKQTDFALKTIENFQKIGKQAILDGFINYEEVQKKMQRASIIVIPSIWDEPFGLVVAEAMSNGVAVVTSKVGGIPEVIKDNGIVLNDINETRIVNALLELLNKPEELINYQKLSWNNFSHTAFLSASKLDNYRNKFMFKFIK